MFTISKVIADSIKEIAVFRSLGARRRDIAQIYATYGFMLAVAALIVAFILALIGAHIISHMYVGRVTEILVQNTGAYTTVVHGSLVGFNALWLLAVTGVLVVAAAIGIAVPVLLSARRKLITILREE
jgi:ABC-type antimicrobial peptide transport system permease subunit